MFMIRYICTNTNSEIVLLYKLCQKSLSEKFSTLLSSRFAGSKVIHYTFVVHTSAVTIIGLRTFNIYTIIELKFRRMKSLLVVSKYVLNILIEMPVLEFGRFYDSIRFFICFTFRAIMW